MVVLISCAGPTSSSTRSRPGPAVLGPRPRAPAGGRTPESSWRHVPDGHDGPSRRSPATEPRGRPGGLLRLPAGPTGRPQVPSAPTPTTRRRTCAGHAAGGAGAPAPDGRGPVHRLRPGRGGPALPVPGLLDFVVNGGWPRGRATTTPTWRPTGSTRPRRGPVGRRRLPGRRALAGALPGLGAPRPRRATGRWPVAGPAPPAGRARPCRRRLDVAARRSRRRGAADRGGRRGLRGEQRRGVPGRPAVRHRGHFHTPRPSRSPLSVVDTRFHLSRSPIEVGLPPRRGEHTEDVLGDLLGYPADRIATLREAGALR